MTDVPDALRALGADAWLVGGVLRDRLLGRETDDYDVAIRGDAEHAARKVARAAHGHAFALSEAFGAWRVVSRDPSARWQVDVSPLHGDTIEEDLAKRDFTINALAEPVAGGECVDPFGGRDDLLARRLVMVHPRAFTSDPLRTLRLARLASELGLSVAPDTAAAARAQARRLADVAAERIFAEFKRVLSSDRALEGLELMDALELTSVVLPELSELRGIEQSQFHHLDVHEHTRAVLAAAIELERNPEVALGAQAEPVARLLAEPLADDLTRGQALRFGALFHDIAKPATRQVTAEGRVTFIGHDELGAQMTRTALARLRSSERLIAHVAALTRHHLRLGFLVHETPISRRAIYRYLQACAPIPIDVTVLSVADRLATRGRGSEAAIAKHLELARQLLGEAFAWLADPPRTLVRGDEIARAVGMRPGPELGRIVAELDEATFAGEIATREEAIERARELLGPQHSQR
jgi:putative nucleotidyltransferase with HDIG domain